MIAKYFSCFFIALFISGCASTTAPKYKSDFLKDYKQFRPNPNADDAWISATSAFDIETFRAYNKMAIAPIALWLNKSEPHLIKDKLKQEQLRQYFEQAIKEKVGNSKQIVPIGTADSVQVNLAITYIGEQTPSMEALDILPFRMVMNGGELAYLAATGQKSSVGQAGIEAEFVDTNSGQKLVAAIINSKTQELYVDNKKENIKAIKPILDSWANRLLKAFSDIKN